MSVNIGVAPKIIITIAGGENIGEHIVAFEWKSFINGGYIIRAKVHDAYLRIVRTLTKENNFLKDARRGPTEVKWKMKWADRPDSEYTLERTAFISDIDIYGSANYGGFDFVAVDPPSWWLNAGNGNGKVYEGKVSDVIKQVVREYSSGITISVSETKDHPKGAWCMMRQDPKTFIQSLLDWSCSLTNNRTNWLVASVDNKLFIKEQYDLLSSSQLLANYHGSFMTNKNDIVDFNLISNVFMTTIQSKLTTQGISAVSGKYFDKETDKPHSEVTDENTNKKINTSIDQSLGYKKPSSDWSTSIMSIPEFNGGELGLKYDDYIDGRARNLYLSMLPMVMRCMITVPGDFRYHDSSKLGASRVSISWDDSDGEQFFLSGRWLIYGFHHRMARGNGDDTSWFTDLYLYRIDYDASAVKV